MAAHGVHLKSQKYMPTHYATPQPLLNHPGQPKTRNSAKTVVNPRRRRFLLVSCDWIPPHLYTRKLRKPENWKFFVQNRNCEI